MPTQRINGWTFIYALCDPRTGRVRYVGKADRPHARLREHLALSGRKRPAEIAAKQRATWAAKRAARAFAEAT